MIACVLCGKPMVLVAAGVLLHVDELTSLLPDVRRTSFQPLGRAS